MPPPAAVVATTATAAATIAAAPATAATAPSAAAAAEATFRFRPGFVHHERATVHLMLVELG